LHAGLMQQSQQNLCQHIATQTLQGRKPMTQVHLSSTYCLHTSGESCADACDVSRHALIILVQTDIRCCCPLYDADAQLKDRWSPCPSSLLREKQQ